MYQKIEIKSFQYEVCVDLIMIPMHLVQQFRWNIVKKVKFYQFLFSALNYDATITNFISVYKYPLFLKNSVKYSKNRMHFSWNDYKW